MIWRMRKRLALRYQDIMVAFFPKYVARKQASRKGACLAEKCPDVLRCCGYCGWLEAKRCTRYEDRPLTCRLPPIDNTYNRIAGIRRCGYYWD